MSVTDGSPGGQENSLEHVYDIYEKKMFDESLRALDFFQDPGYPTFGVVTPGLTYLCRHPPLLPLRNPLWS